MLFLHNRYTNRIFCKDLYVRINIITFAAMNEPLSLHLIANCVAGFSFLTSAGFMALVRVPFVPMWEHLRKCKRYMSLVFLVVGLSCGKNIFLPTAPQGEIIVTSTLISAGIQALLFACTGVTFVNPSWLKRRWVWGRIGIVLAYALFLLYGLLIQRAAFWTFATIASLVYFALIAEYQFIFYREYKLCVEQTDAVTDEYSESRYAWIKHFFMTVSTLGVTAGIAPFLPVTVYDIWMIAAACVYVYVVISFVNYCGSTSMLVNKVFEAESFANQKLAGNESKQEVEAATTEVPKAEVAEIMDFSELEAALEAWVEKRGFIKNDQVSSGFAESLGVNLVTFRTYFSQKYQMDFRQWRTKLRIEYACEILRDNPDLSYDIIAEMIGIGDRSNFLRTFKKITGKTPREYAQSANEESL